MLVRAADDVPRSDRSPPSFHLRFQPGARMLPDDVIATALLLPEVVRGAHNGNPDFRVGGRIFATLWIDEDRLVVRLTPDLQADMVAADPDVFEPIPGAWGGRGWTNVDLDAIDEEALRTVLLASWSIVAPAGLVAAHRDHGLVAPPALDEVEY